MAEKLKLVALQHLGGLYQAILEDKGKPNEHLHVEYQGPVYAPRK
jgi:hypothetical protein